MRTGLYSRIPGRALLTTLFLASCSADDPTGPEGFGGEPPVAAVAEFVDLVNAHRTSVGCAPMAWNGAVASVAQSHSEDMVARSFFDHENPDGQGPRDRIDEAGIDWSRYGENIAFGYANAQAVLSGWLGSPGHKANIENCAFTEHGVGLDGTYWTHVFLTP